MTRGRRLLTVLLALLASLALSQIASAQEANPAHDLDALQKRLGEAQGKSPMPAKEGLKRRDLKGQAMSQQAEPEGLTPEQKKMYEDLQQQLQQIKENRAKSNAALEELMTGDGR